ncbi:unnamed protein product [Meganyctiphanes norvegica]|uniref:RNA-directed DNA polymerase n=1 Tax=Meganyctiphanes norvegica TaxID=48144 RepID=A0AAV2SX99_MEGNR
MSSDDLARGMSVKCAEIKSVMGILNSVSCLAELPDPMTTTVSICKIIGTQPSAVWDVIPLSVKDVAKATREDKVYAKLITAVRGGQIDIGDIDMKPFISMFSDFYVEQGVIFYGTRIVVPTRQQQRLLYELHTTHIGIVKMKGVARECFWWPQINNQIEEIAGSCNGCNKYKRRPAPAPLCPWPYARRSMERVHIDFGEYKGKQMLIMIDAYSKYIWAYVMNADTTAMKTLAVLYSWFCDRSGFPATLVSDNGPQFISKEFADKMAKWGIKHLLTPPYHPASNGLAEKAVGIVKDKLKKMDSSANPFDLHVNLQAVLRVYRASPHSSTDQTPFELISTAPVPVMFPQLQLSQQKNQEVRRSLVPKTRMKQARTFMPGDSVLVYDTITKTNTYGLVKENRSNNSYLITVGERDKHISSDHLTLRNKDSKNYSANTNDTNVISDRDSNSEGTANVDKSDNISVISDDFQSEISDDSEEETDSWLPFNNCHENMVNRSVKMQYRGEHMTRPVKRKYRGEHTKLYDSLSTSFPSSRTRSGKINQYVNHIFST